MIIGGPVSHREWILDAWYEHTLAAVEHAGITARFLHVGNPASDPDTWKIIDKNDPGDTLRVVTDEPDRDDKRKWHWERYRQMADLRNQGLAVVRDAGPDFFLSLDTDILLHRHAISSLLDAIDGWDAAGGFCYMTHPSRHEVSWGLFKPGGGLIRRATEPNCMFRVDVIMGIKLMSPAAYNVDYKFDKHGEDIGWARNMQAARLRIRWDGRVISKHVYTRNMLTMIDKRLGW